MERRRAEREAAEMDELRRLQVELAAGEPYAGTPTAELHGEQLGERLQWLAMRGRELTLRARRDAWDLPRQRQPLRAIAGDGEAIEGRASLRPVP